MAVSVPVTAPTTEEALARLDDLLDLANVRMKLSDPDEGKGYDRARLDLMEGEYRKFLALHLAYPDMDVVPCQIADEMAFERGEPASTTAARLVRSALAEHGATLAGARRGPRPEPTRSPRSGTAIPPSCATSQRTRYATRASPSPSPR